MEIVKQPDFQVFASEAKSGEVLEFPNILRGWGVTLDQTQGKPPLEWMNDAFKRIDINNLYHLQQGIPEWNKSVRYPVNAIVKHIDKIYLCLAENENNEPHLNSDKWTLYVKKATTSQQGITQLTSTLSDREDLAATTKLVNDTKINLTNDINKKADKIKRKVVDVKSTRFVDVTYTNNTDFDMYVVVCAVRMGMWTRVGLIVDGNSIVSSSGKANDSSSNEYSSLSCVIPPGSKYTVPSDVVLGDIITWLEVTA